MEWQNGRQLSRATTERDSTTEDVLDFAYDANGIRTRKTVTRNTYRPVQTYKVTFVADGKTVKTMNVTEGYTLKDSDYPAVPEKAGYTGAWQRYPSPVQSNVTVSATYTRLTAQYTVTFLADGFTVKTMQVYSGYVLKDSDYPSVPEKVGYTGHWNKITAPITKNTFVYAVYYSTDPTHIVTFYFAGEDYGTLTVDDGYILQDCDYPELPTRDGYTAYWDTYTQPIRKDITVTGNWEENAIIPPQPTDPPEIMSGDASEPVEAGAEAYASGALVSTETVTHEYLTQSGKIVREVITAPTETTTLDFFYDESGRPFAFNYSVDGSDFETYYYILNLQGDVVQIIDANGVMQAEYIYSPWGEIISAEGDLAEINPLRYRGYYYDSETGFYYLQSRYYDPENHRFINADTYASTDSSDAIACNMFAYCENVPTILADENGDTPQCVFDGLVHNLVLAKICETNPDLQWWDTCIYYNGKNFWGGYGYCDLYNNRTGEVWELKKDSKSRSCRKKNALKQLDRYISGALKHNMDLQLKRPSETVIPGGYFTFKSGLNEYDVYYWNEGDGILRYDYDMRLTQEAQYGIATATAVTVIAAAAVSAMVLVLAIL